MNDYDAQQRAAQELELTRERVIREIEAQYTTDLKAGCPTPYGFNVKTTVEDAVIWEKGLSVIPEGTESIDVFGADDVTHTITIEQARAVPAMQVAYFQHLSQKKWAMITAAKAGSATEASLNALCWRTWGE